MAMIGVIPFGSWEFHGPHLPPATDRILADYFAAALTDDHAEGSWQAQLKPTVPYGVSDEHLWHHSTTSVTAATLRAVAVDLCLSMHQGPGIARFVLLNCHGGNRPVLELVCDELYWSGRGIEAILVNPISLIAAQFANSNIPDVHAGLLETSLMLEISPDSVKVNALDTVDFSCVSPSAVRDRVACRGVYWPWSSQDPTLAADGIIGDPRQASPELGRQIADAAKEALQRVVGNFASQPSSRSKQEGDG